MTKDRLSELRAAQSDDEDDICYGVEERNCYMADFFAEVQQIRDNITKMRINVNEVRKSHSAILSAPQTDDKLTHKLQDLLADIKRTANRVRDGLKAMERNIEELAQTSWMSADFRIRKTQHSMLSQMFVEVMADYNETQSDYRQRCKARIRRQFEITGRYVSDDDVEQMIETGDVAVFTQDIVTDTQIAKQILADIEARHEDIIKLENSIRELHDMFMDLAVLSECQGELVNRIEHHVEQSYKYIEIALGETIAARRARKKERRKRILMSICLMVLVIVLISVVSGLLGL